MLAQSIHPCSPVRPCRQRTRQTCGRVQATCPNTENVLLLQIRNPNTSTAGVLTVSRREQLAIITAAGLFGIFPRKSIAADDLALAYSGFNVVDAIRRDFVDRQYYVTGDLSPELFAPNCVFKDPTTEVVGVEPYVKALQTLFEPSASRADLISIRKTAPDTVILRWRLEGALKFGRLKIKPYTGTTVYTIASDGKIVRHEEIWDISTLDAFVSVLFPSFGAPSAPPVTTASH